MSDEKENNTQNENRSPLSEGMLLAGIPAIAYAMTYVYEWAYCDHFSIPKGLIQITPLTVTASCWDYQAS